MGVACSTVVALLALGRRRPEWRLAAALLLQGCAMTHRGMGPAVADTVIASVSAATAVAVAAGADSAEHGYGMAFANDPGVRGVVGVLTVTAIVFAASAITGF